MSEHDYITRKYKEFYEKNGYIPEMFSAYNGSEVTDFAPTLCCSSGSPSGLGSVLILEKVEHQDKKKQEGAVKTMADNSITTDNRQTKIQIDKIIPNPLNTFEITGIEELRANIAMNGLLTPLTVLSDTDDTYILISGERRYHALKPLAKENPTFQEVPCYVVGNSDMPEVEQRLLIESANVETREFDRDSHNFEIARLLMKLGKDKELKRNQLTQQMAEILNKTNRYARMYFKILEADPRIEELVVEKRLYVNEASQLAGTEKSEREQIIQHIIDEDLSAKESRKYLSDRKNGKTNKHCLKSNRTEAKREQCSLVSKPDKKQVTEHDNKIIEALINENEVSDEDVSEAFRHLAFDTNKDLGSLEIDSTGELRHMEHKDDTAKNTVEVNSDILKEFCRWCESVMERDTNGEELSDDEWDAVEICKSMADQLYS